MNQNWKPKTQSQNRKLQRKKIYSVPSTIGILAVWFHSPNLCCCCFVRCKWSIDNHHQHHNQRYRKSKKTTTTTIVSHHLLRDQIKSIINKDNNKNKNEKCQFNWTIYTYSTTGTYVESVSQSVSQSMYENPSSYHITIMIHTMMIMMMMTCVNIIYRFSLLFPPYFLSLFPPIHVA